MRQGTIGRAEYRAAVEAIAARPHVLLHPHSVAGLVYDLDPFRVRERAVQRVASRRRQGLQTATSAVIAEQMIGEALDAAMPAPRSAAPAVQSGAEARP